MARPRGDRVTIEEVKSRNSAPSLRVRWSNADGSRPTYGKVADRPDADAFCAYILARLDVEGSVTRASVPDLWRAIPSNAGPSAELGLTFEAYMPTFIASRKKAQSERKKMLENRLRNWFKVLYSMPLAEIDEDTIDSIVDFDAGTIVVDEVERHLASTTFWAYLWDLRAYFRQAVKDNKILRSPLEDVCFPSMMDVSRIDGKESFNLSEENYGKLIRAAADFEPSDYHLLTLILFSGLRIGEALALRVKDVEWWAGYVHVEQSLKRGNEAVGPVKRATIHVRSEANRTVPVDLAVLKGLGDWLTSLGVDLATDGEQYVFAAPRSVKRSAVWGYEGWHRQRWQQIVARARKDYGLPDETLLHPTPHRLRHTYASRLLRLPQYSVIEVSRLLGHKSTRTTERIYAHVCGELLRLKGEQYARTAIPMPDVTPVSKRPSARKRKAA